MYIINCELYNRDTLQDPSKWYACGPTRTTRYCRGWYDLACLNIPSTSLTLIIRPADIYHLYIWTADLNILEINLGQTPSQIKSISHPRGSQKRLLCPLLHQCHYCLLPTNWHAPEVHNRDSVCSLSHQRYCLLAKSSRGGKGLKGA